MIVIPAVDIKDGKCVRLFQGDMARITVFSDDPAEMAARWERAGAERLHVVDLDGAVHGSLKNRRAIEKLLREVSIPVQLGGGVRTLDTVEFYLELGIQQVILGTAAQKTPELLKEACRRFEGRIAAGIDARNGYVAVEGWTEDTGEDAFQMARRLEETGVGLLIYTDIARDGMRSGPNLESTRRMCRTVQIPVVCAGGVTNLDDIRNLTELEPDGLVGAITGRAIYEGTLDLVSAIELARAGGGSVRRICQPVDKRYFGQAGARRWDAGRANPEE